jgi:FKBP-type peptidyl-prolyl cis-trans isomerase
MPSSKRRKGTSSAATARRAPTPANSSKPPASATRATATAASPQPTSQSTPTSAPRPAGQKAASGTSSAIVRRASVAQAGYRSRMTRAARQRRQRSVIAGTVVGVLVVGAFGWLLWSQLPVFHPPVVHTCSTNARTGLDGTPTSAGGPPSVSGKLVTLDRNQCLQYIDVKTGTGAAVKAGDKVTVGYTGWLANGTKFDSSADHPGQPFSFTVGQGQVIPGWDKGLIGMKVGGERRLIIPPSLGYGAQGAGSTIPPNATLVFDVTIVSIG